MSLRISKALRSLSGGQTVKKASRGTMSDYVLNAMPQYGQPPNMYGDAAGLITAERMREVVVKTPTAAACMLATMDYCIDVPIGLRNRDASKPVPASQRRFIEDLMRQPNTEENAHEFKEKLYRDLITLGACAIEIERNSSGGVANLWPLDGARIRIDYDEHGQTIGYDMLNIHGMPIAGEDGIHAWLPNDIIYIQRGSRTESRYPHSRIVPLFAAAVLESLIMTYIGDMFTMGNVPYGVMDLGDVSDLELEAAVSIWNNQAKKQGRHRIMLTGSKGGLHFIPFNGQLKDLDAKNLLMQVRSQIMAIMGVTVNELGEAEDVNKSNGFNLSYSFKKRAVEPVLDPFCDKLTDRLLWQELGYKEVELYAEEIDSRDELLQGQIDDLYMKGGVWSVNHVRNRKGLPNIPGGDEPFLMLGTNVLPLSMVNDFAQAQLDAIQSEIALMKEQVKQAKLETAMGAVAGASSKPPITPPIIRGAQEPEHYTTIGGQGSSTTKLKMPTPKLAPPRQTPQAARGPVQAAKNAGIRKPNQ
jgi:phage portal protein BeeE